MTKSLFLMRHAEAANASPDIERPLTPRGEAMAQKMAAEISKRGALPELVLCSPAKRTRITCDILRENWGGSAPPAQIENTLYGADIEDVVRLIKAQKNDIQRLMIVGHNPWAHLLALLLPQSAELNKKPELKSFYPPAACTILEFAGDEWQSVAKASATLRDFFYV